MSGRSVKRLAKSCLTTVSVARPKYHSASDLPRYSPETRSAPEQETILDEELSFKRKRRLGIEKSKKIKEEQRRSGEAKDKAESTELLTRILHHPLT